MAVGTLSIAVCYLEEEDGGTIVTTDSANADLIEIGPGLEVVANYDAPIFFADDYYWWNLGGIWYWSTWYGGGWARAPHIPPHVAGIQHPERYAHYRPEGWVPRSARAPAQARSYGGVPSRGGGFHSRPAPHGGRR